MNHIKYYIKIHNWHMAFRMIILYIKLWWPVWCDCYLVTDKARHRVEVMYWARTAYHWNKKGIDPNGPIICCKDIADERREYWDYMWAEYYSQTR